MGAKWEGLTHIKDEERVLTIHDFWSAVRRNLVHLLVPPFVPSFNPRNALAGPLQNQDVLHFNDTSNSCVDDSLGSDRFATTTTFISGNDNSASTIENALAESLGAESGKDHRVYGANTGTCEEGGGSLPCHRKVNSDSVALLNAK